MIIDIHAHCFPEEIAAAALGKLSNAADCAPQTDGTLDGLMDSMKRNGIDKSVILPVATRAKQVPHINDFAMALTERCGDCGILSFGGIHPDYADFKRELNRLKDGGIKGVKIHPVYQETAITDRKFMRVLYRAAELNLPVITHAGYDIGFPGKVCCSPRMLREVVDAIGNFPLIAAHMGGWREWDEAKKYLADTGVYIDTAFSLGSYRAANESEADSAHLRMLTAADFEDFLAAFGAERILFGSDSPWQNQGDVKNFVQNLPNVTDDDKRKILGDNAEKLLR